MSQSRSGKLDPDLEGVELLFPQKVGSASFGAKMAVFERSGSGLYEPNLLGPLVQQSAQISSMINGKAMKWLADETT